MKSILIIGAGQFGKSLALGLAEKGNQVMVVDNKEENITDLLPFVSGGRIGDCTNEKVLQSLGVSEYDICFVCLGDTTFQACLEITAMLKDLNAKYIVSKSNKELHSKLLLKIGANEVVYPDKDIAERCSVKYSSESVFDYFELEDGYCIYELNPIKKWIGKTLAESDIRSHYNVNVIAYRPNGGTLVMNPMPSMTITADMRLLVIGKLSDLQRIEKKLEI